MKTRIIPLALFVAIMAAATAVYFHASAARASAEESRTALTSERAGLEAALKHAEGRIAAARQARAETQRALAALPPANRSASPQTTEKKAASSPTAPGAITPALVLANDPKLQAMMLMATRARVARDNARLFAALHLSPAQIEQFTQNALKREEALVDLAGVEQSQGKESKASVDAWRKKANDEFRAAQLELLGTAGMQQWDDYQRMAPARRMVDGFAGTLVFEGVPLTPQQGEQLIAAFSHAVAEPRNGNAIDWAAIDAAVQPVLDPRQMAIFQTGSVIGGISRQQVQLDAAVSRALEAERKAAGAAVPPPGT
jgi:hypothetical protein